MQQAWNGEQQYLFVEAAMSLPNVAYKCMDFDVMFEALQFKSPGIQLRLEIGGKDTAGNASELSNYTAIRCLQHQFKFS